MSLNRRKILTVCRGMYPTSIGGAEIHVYEVSRNLLENNDVAVLFEKRGKDRNKSKLYEIAINSSKSSIRYVLGGLLAIFKSGFRPQIILAHTAYAPMIVALLASFFFRTPFIITVHGSDVRIDGRTTWMKYLQKMVLKRAGRIISVSREMKEILVNEYELSPEDIVVIPNGFDTNLLETESNREKSTDCVLSFVGNLKWQKNPFLAIKAVERLRRRHPNIRLDIVGDGVLGKKVEEMINKYKLENTVRLLGSVSHGIALEVIANSDIFILPSLQEGLPVVLMEAMALAKPVIAADVGGVGELLNDGNNGLSFQNNDLDAFCECIEKLMSDQELAQKLALAARESVSEKTWDSVSKSYESVLGHVFQKR